MSTKNIRSNQSGMVSIMVTMIMIVVITLIVLGFAQVVHRNQREALDRQLSTQAYYAAETGVNDAYTAVFKNNYVPVPGDGQKCSGPGSFINNAGLSSNISTDGSVAYTCLLVTSKISKIIKAVPYGASETVPLQASAAPNTLTFTWDPGSSGPAYTSCPNNFQFTPATGANGWVQNCPYGMLRLDLYNNGSGANSADAMAANTISVFFYPSTANAVQGVTFGTNSSVYLVKAKCDAVTCRGTISGISGLDYYARLSSIYEGLGNVQITAGNPATTFQGWLQIDATGKSQDELRRVQVLVPNNSATNFPDLANAIGSGSAVCKQYPILGAGHRANDGTDADIPSELCPIASAQPPGNGNGGANFTPTGGVGGAPSWFATFINTTPAPPGQILSCTWNFGDGTTSTSNCNNGDQQTHLYPNNGGNSSCYIPYTVTLVEITKNGTYNAPPKTVRMPQPNQSGSPC